MDSIEVMEEEDLRVTLATIARALAFTRLPDLDDYNVSNRLQ